MNDFERYAIGRLIKKANALGVDVPPTLSDLCTKSFGTGGAILWAHANPGWTQAEYCCDGAELYPDGCTCWTPVYTEEQQTPRPPAGPDDITVQTALCGDCAYRPGSPERADDYSRGALYALADRGDPFWCHQGMRRPIRWEHPDGRVIDGDPDDWKPPIAGGIPFRADGSPGLLCAGWAARAATHTTFVPDDFPDPHDQPAAEARRLFLNHLVTSEPGAGTTDRFNRERS